MGGRVSHTAGQDANANGTPAAATPAEGTRTHSAMHVRMTEVVSEDNNNALEHAAAVVLARSQEPRFSPGAQVIADIERYGLRESELHKITRESTGPHTTQVVADKVIGTEIRDRTDANAIFSKAGDLTSIQGGFDQRYDYQKREWRMTEDFAGVGPKNGVFDKGVLKAFLFDHSDIANALIVQNVDVTVQDHGHKPTHISIKQLLEEHEKPSGKFPAR